MALSRNVKKANTHKVVTFNYTLTNKSMQATESLTESNVLLSLEFDKRIESLITQPDTFKNTTGEAGWRQYTPDLRIDYKDLNINYGEIKPYQISQTESFKQKFKLHQRIVKERTGKDLKLFTDKDLTPMKIVQFRQLKTYLRFPLLDNVDSQTLSQLPDNKPFTLGFVESITKQLGVPAYYPMVMLAHQKLRTLKCETITRNTLVEVA
tara:strand:+ start:37472 stop:38098 length:627 start_codon:yes stop_codon:yes gene_type:complete